MLTDYILYKNTRNRFISLELQENNHHYSAYIISKSGNHRYIGSIGSSSVNEFVLELKLTKATETEYALNALYRINDDLDKSYSEEEDG